MSKVIDVKPKLDFLDYRIERLNKEYCSHTFNEVEQYKISVVVKNWHKELSDLKESRIITTEQNDEIWHHFFEQEKGFKKDMTDALDKAAKEVLAKYSEKGASYCQKYIVIREKHEQEAA